MRERLVGPNQQVVDAAAPQLLLDRRLVEPGSPAVADELLAGLGFLRPEEAGATQLDLGGILELQHDDDSCTCPSSLSASTAWRSSCRSLSTMINARFLRLGDSSDTRSPIRVVSS